MDGDELWRRDHRPRAGTIAHVRLFAEQRLDAAATRAVALDLEIRRVDVAAAVPAPHARPCRKASSSAHPIRRTSPGVRRRSTTTTMLMPAIVSSATRASALIRSICISSSKYCLARLMVRSASDRFSAVDLDDANAVQELQEHVEDDDALAAHAERARQRAAATIVMGTTASGTSRNAHTASLGLRTDRRRDETGRLHRLQKAESPRLSSPTAGSSRPDGRSGADRRACGDRRTRPRGRGSRRTSRSIVPSSTAVTMRCSVTRESYVSSAAPRKATKSRRTAIHSPAPPVLAAAASAGRAPSTPPRKSRISRIVAAVSAARPNEPAKRATSRGSSRRRRNGSARDSASRRVGDLWIGRNGRADRDGPGRRARATRPRSCSPLRSAVS